MPKPFKNPNPPKGPLVGFPAASGGSNFKNPNTPKKPKTGSSSAYTSAGGKDPRAVGNQQMVDQFPGSSSIDWMPSNVNVGTGGVAGVGNRALLDDYNANGPTSGLPRLPSPRSGGGGGGGGRGGGGGGGGVSDAAAAQAQWDALLQLLGSDMFKPQLRQTAPQSFDASIFDRLRGSVNQAATTDRGAANTAYDQLASALASGYKNAYAGGPQARAVAGDTSMANLLASQGANPQGYVQQAQAATQAGADSDRQFANLFATLAANADTSQQSRVAEGDQARAYANRNIDAQLAAMLTGVDTRQAQAQLEFDERQRQLQREDELYNAQQTQSANQQRLQAMLPVLQLLAESGVAIPNLRELGVI